MEVHRHLDEELDTLRATVLRLGGEAEAALVRAMHALTERDTAAAREVLAHDDDIDQLEVEVDRQCVDIFALRQPAARDLRFVMSVAKMAPVLERIADHACNIARAAVDLDTEPELKDLSRLLQMGKIASSMLSCSLTGRLAFHEHAAVSGSILE